MIIILYLSFNTAKWSLYVHEVFSTKSVYLLGISSIIAFTGTLRPKN